MLLFILLLLLYVRNDDDNEDVCLVFVFVYNGSLKRGGAHVDCVESNKVPTNDLPRHVTFSIRTPKFINLTFSDYF
jgi:hypothetical protein